MNEPITFTLAVLALLITPGPTNTLLATAGAISGGRRPIGLLLGEIAGYMIAINMIALVVVPLLRPSKLAMLTLNVVCASYLFYAAARLLRTRGEALIGRDPVSTRDVFVTTLFNPKGAIFALFIVPYLKDGAVASALPYLLVLALCIVIVGGGWYMLGAGFRRGSGQRVSNIFIRRCGGAVLGFYAVLLSSAAVRPLLLR